VSVSDAHHVACYLFEGEAWPGRGVACLVDSDSASPARGARNHYFLMSFTVLSIFLPAVSEGPLPISLS
jgi:hypothetical protein